MFCWFGLGLGVGVLGGTYALWVVLGNGISSWMPGLLRGNYVLKDGNTLVAYGLQGRYLYDNYTTGTDPLLILVSVE